MIRVLENTRQTIPAALNQAIAHAEGEYIVRLDAHTFPNRTILNIVSDLYRPVRRIM